MNTMKTIIFDFDGVIHDTFETAFSIHKKLFPDSAREEYKDFFNGNIFTQIEKISDDEQKVRDEFRALEHEAFKELQIEREIRYELEKLAKEYQLHIISSNTLKNLTMYFENNNFTNIFDNILAEETHKSKLIKFEMLLRKNNLDKSECIFITDTLGDILEANKAGIRTIAVDFGFHERERLEKGNPWKIVSDFKEIRRIVNNHSLNSQGRCL